ncbi:MULTISPECIES: restriction endonuclease subunit S [unclassified Xanthobacter]|uniref:restriction endonuclease subunit S n=1 Tax=unclassified Xanthobacter TaxID=2623496 RepID=UPI001EDDF855
MKHSPNDSVSVEEFCITGSGGTPSRSNSDFYGGSIPWVKSGELRETIILDTEEKITEEAINKSSAKIVPEGAILLAMYGATIGRLAILGVEAATNQAVCNIRPDVTVADTRYVYRALEAKVPELIGQASGGAQPNISQEKIRKLRIPLPPLDEQKRIAAILDKADALRRKRRQALALLDSLTQSIFLEMFGDPKTEPNRWPTVSFAEACRDETSKSPKVLRGNYAEEGDIPVVDQGQKLIAGYTNQENVCVSRGPITLFGDHTRAVKFIDFDFAIGADGAKALKASECYEPIFFAALLSRLPIPDLGYSRHMREVKKLRFPVPDFDLQSLYAKKRSGLRVQERILANAVLMDDSLFASLQHRAFTGQL